MNNNKAESIIAGQKYMRIYLINTKQQILLSYLMAYFLLCYGYAEFIVPIYGYSGFEWMPNNVKVFESLVALVFFAAILPSVVKRPSDFFIHVHFLLPVVPMLVLYSVSDLPRTYMYFVLLAFAVVCVVRNFKLPKIKGDIIPIQIMMYGLLIITAIYIFSIILHGGLRYFNLDLMKVYEFRDLAAENLPGISEYLSPVVEKVLLPFILLLSVYRRKWFIACLALAGSVMMLGLTGNKGALFYPFFVLGIYWIMNSHRQLIQLLLVAYILVILVSLTPFLINNYWTMEPSLSGIIVGSLFLRRGYFIPAQLNFYYYDFFSTHPHTMWAQSKLTLGLVDYPYDLDSSHLIGYHYYKDVTTGANTGWLGSGYMHFGFAGLLFYALLVGLLFSIVDILAKRRKLGITGALIFTPFFALFLSSDLPTTMLTHGLLLAMILAWACRLKET